MDIDKAAQRKVVSGLEKAEAAGADYVLLDIDTTMLFKERKLPTAPWKRLCRASWTTMNQPTAMTITSMIWMKSGMTPMC